MLLKDEEIAERLKELSGWERRGKEIHRLKQFADFTSAMEFVNRVAQLAEAADHHPDILIEYNRVTLKLSTHSAGGLTLKDFDLARQINSLP